MLTGKYLKYTPEITFEIFQKIWDRLVENGWKHIIGDSSGTTYSEFKEEGYFGKSSIEKVFSVYDSPYGISTTIEEILGYNPFETKSEEFVLPEKWCVKTYNDCNGEVVGAWFDKQSNQSCYRSGCLGEYYHSHNYINQNICKGGHLKASFAHKKIEPDFTEITFDQFKQFVLKEPIEEKVEDKPKFEAGKWYKFFWKWNKAWYYGKFLSETDDCISFKYWTKISDKGFSDSQSNPSVEKVGVDSISEANLSEIQQYLPDGHTEVNETCPDCNDDGIVDKPIEKWSVGSYVVCIKDYGSYFKVGNVAQLEDGVYKIDENCVNLSKWAGHACMPFKDKCEWFATLQEAEEFSKQLLNPKEMGKPTPRFKAGDEVVFKELKDIGQLEYYNKTPEIGKKYIVSHAGPYKFDSCNGNCINIEEIYGGWIPEEAVEPYVKSDKPTECEAPKSPKITKCPFEEGNLVSCEIDGEDVHSGRIHYEDDEIYICQDVRDGSRCKDTLGYKYSWCVAHIDNDWEAEIEYNSVTNIQRILQHFVDSTAKVLYRVVGVDTASRPSSIGHIVCDGQSINPTIQLVNVPRI